MLQVPLGKSKNPTANLIKGAQFPYLSFFRETLRKAARYSAYAAQGTITMAALPANGDVFTIGSKTYTWQTTLTNVDGNIFLPATLALAQQAVINAINCTGIAGSQYAAAMSENPEVSAATAWVANTLVITAKTPGTAGNSIVFTDSSANMTMNGGGVLGATRAGVDESDADSFLFSSQMTNSANNFADDQDRYFKNLNDTDLRWGAAWLNMEFQTTSEVLATNASRKISLPDHYGRRYKNIRSVVPAIWTQKDQRASIASPFAAHSSNGIYKAINVDSTRTAYLFNVATGTTGTYLVIASIAANGVQTFGTPVIVDTNQSIDYVDMVLVNTDKILLCYANAGATNFITTRTASISVLSITMNAGVQVAATAATTLNSLVKIGTDKAMLAWANGTQVSYQVVTVTGTVPSYGSAANITSTPTYTKMVQNGTDKLQSFYVKSSACYTVAITVSGTATTIGTEQEMMKGTLMGSRNQHDAYQVATDEFIWLGSNFDEAANGDRRNGAYITVLSTTSTVAQTVKSGCNGNEHLRIMEVTAGTDYIFYYKNGTSMFAKNMTIDTAANTITFPYGNPEPEYTNLDYAAYGFFTTIFYSQVAAFPNVGGLCQIVKTGNHTIMMYLGLGSYFHYFTTNQVTLDVSVNEVLVQSQTYKYPFAMEPKFLNTSVMDTKADIKIKNTFAQSIFMRLHHTWVEIE